MNFSAARCPEGPGKPRVGVVALGPVPALATKSISAHLAAYLGLEAEVLAPRSSPEYALDRRRLQYDAGPILKTMGNEPSAGCAKVVGVLEQDLFIPIFTHVFGEAAQGGRCALVSLHRLQRNPDGSPLPEAVWLERAAKVALHETGHLFNLLHCTDERCLMHFCGDVLELDRTPLFFCRYCSAFFRDALRSPARG